MGRMLVVVLSVLGLNCFSTTQYDVANSQRVAGINAKYAAEKRRVDAEYSALFHSLDKLREYLIPIEEGTSYAPRDSVDERQDVVSCRSACAGSERCIKDSCEATYVSALLSTYFKADVDWVVEQLKEVPTADMESLLAYSHNQAILGYIGEETKSIGLLHRRALESVEAHRQQAVMASWQQRAIEVSSGRAEYAARMRMVAAVFSALGNSRQTTASPHPAVLASGPACTSDFACGMGFQCVKPAYSTQGTCLKAVNEYGNQVFELPRMDSIGPNVSIGCKASLDCPLGFRCDLVTGACLR